MTSTPVRDNVAKFKDYLESVGSIPYLDGEKWVRDNWEGDTPDSSRTYNLVTTWGYRAKNNMWHRDGDLLNWGPRPKSVIKVKPEVRSDRENDDDDDETPEDPALGDPKDQFAAVGMSLGIAERYARSTAAYVTGSYNIWDPLQVWEALKECTDVNITQRQRWWKTWCSKIQVEPSPDLQREVNKVAPYPASDQTREVSRKRLYVVEDGHIIPTTSDDELGVPFSEAYRMARLEQGSQGGPQPSSDNALVALITQSGESDRARMQMESERRSQGRPESEMEARVEGVRRESEARIKAIEEQNTLRLQLQAQEFKHLFETNQAEQRHQLEIINRNLERMMSRPSEEDNDIVKKLDRTVPGLGSVFAMAMQNILTPPQSSVINLNGESMNLDAYERIKAVEDRREMLKITKDAIPEVIQVVKDMIEAKQRVVEEESRGKSQNVAGDLVPDATSDVPRPEVPRRLHERDGVCIECGLLVSFMGSAFQCPRCSAMQTAEGIVFTIKQPVGQLSEQPANESSNQPLGQSLGQPVHEPVELVHSVEPVPTSQTDGEENAILYSDPGTMSGPSWPDISRQPVSVVVEEKAPSVHPGVAPEAGPDVSARRLTKAQIWLQSDKHATTMVRMYENSHTPEAEAKRSATLRATAAARKAAKVAEAMKEAQSKVVDQPEPIQRQEAVELIAPPVRTDADKVSVPG